MAKIIEVNGKLEVKKADIVVKARYKLNPLSLKFITTLISTIKKSDEINELYIFKVKDFQELIQLKRKDLYWAVKEALKELLEKPIYIPKPKSKNDNSFLILNWVASAEYKDGEGLIEFEISNKLRPYLLEAQEKFLKYKLENILPLKSSYSIRLYEILKDWYEMNKRYRNKAEKIIKLDELREILEIPKSYQYSSHIKKRILEKSQKELELYTDIVFDFEEIKTGKKITHLKLNIQENPNSIISKQNIKIMENNNILTKKIEKKVEIEKKVIDFKNLKFKDFKQVLVDNYSGYYLGEYENKSITLSESGYIELDGKRVNADESFDVWEELFINRAELKPKNKEELNKIKKEKEDKRYLEYIQKLREQNLEELVGIDNNNYKIINLVGTKEKKGFIIIIEDEKDPKIKKSCTITYLSQLQSLKDSVIKRASKEAIDKFLNRGFKRIT